MMWLSPTILLIANIVNNTLDLWDVTSSCTHPVGILGLPVLQERHQISINCECQPSPTVTGTANSKRLFNDAPNDAIAMFQIYVHWSNEMGTESKQKSWLMYVHRRTLLSICALNPCLPDDVQSIKRTCNENGVVPWDTWGPHATRWIPNACLSQHDWWQTATAGARVAVTVDRSGSTVIMDFHPPRINIARAKLLANKSANPQIWVQEEETVVDSGMFKESFTSRLPYVARVFGKIERYADLLMDEERLVVLKVSFFF